MSERIVNWAGNLVYGAAKFHRPSTLEELRAVVLGARRVRALGSRHSFNRLADTSDHLVSMEAFDRVIAIDDDRRTVTVEGGIRYGTLAETLQARGWALANLASLPHISVVGACATATHGSGDANGNLATAVAGMQVMTASGALIEAVTGDDDFEGWPVSLGALGVVTRVTLAIQPSFAVGQTVYEGLPFERLFANFDEITGSAYSVSVFTDWQGDAVNQVWRKVRVGDPDRFGDAEQFFGAARATRKLNPLTAMSADNCTEQMGVSGSWHTRLPHFRLGFTPSQGEELQSEYIVPRANALDAIRAVRTLGPRLAPMLFVSEIRTIAADSLWLSPCCGGDAVGIHFTWRPLWQEVRELLPEIERALSPFQARPHWGKLFAVEGEAVRALYPRLDEFRRLTRRLDPDGKFTNEFVARHIGL